MKKQKLLIALLIALCFTASSQNLVPNNSFENYDSTYSATIFPYFNRTFESIENWRTQWPMFNTPDLFFEDSYIFFEDVTPILLQIAINTYNTGLGVNYASMPTNYAGFQYPRTGNKYIGLRSETPIINNNGVLSNNPYHEYIQIELSDSLEADKSYQVTFYISLSDNSLLQNNSIGAMLSQEDEFNFGVIAINPDINPGDSLINSEDWTEVTGNYIAQGGEKFLSIGNLNLQTVTDTFLQMGDFNSIYYYLDDIAVFENNVVDTILCPNDTLAIKIPGANTNLWQDGSTDSIFVVTEAGIYWNRASFNNINHTDTFKVNYYDPLSIITTSDTTICYDASIELSASHNFDDVTYNWSTGDTSSSIVVSEEGNYFIYVRNLCEKQGDGITVSKTPKIEFELGNDTILCPNNSLEIKPQYNEAEYQWQDESSDSNFIVTQTGQYWLTMSNQCESIKDSINVEILEKLELDFGKEEQKVCQFPFTLSVYNKGADYKWHNNSINSSYKVEGSETIWVEISNQCEI